MASIKKVKPIRIIEKDEFIGALDLKVLQYGMENHLEHEDSSLEIEMKQKKKEYEKNASAFAAKYEQSWVDTVWEIFRWKDYVWKGKTAKKQVSNGFLMGIHMKLKDYTQTMR